MISDQDAWKAGTNYADKFNTWGKSYDNGKIQFAKSYDAAVYAYDMSILGTGQQVMTTRFQGIMLPGVNINDFYTGTAHATIQNQMDAGNAFRNANQGGLTPQYPRGAIGGPVPYYGNFLGPGPDGNPYNLKGYDHKTLKPIDMLDAAAQRHDYAYYRHKTGGVNGALWDDSVGAADRELAYNAWVVVDMYTKGMNDVITHQPITKKEFEWASRVEEAFGLLGTLKGIDNFLRVR